MDNGPGSVGSTTSGAGSRFRSFPATASEDTSPGWFIDPWGVGAFRFWDGSAWSKDVARRRRSMRVAKSVRIALIVASVVSGVYLVLWLFLFPLLVLNDADNGCLGHDITHIWLPIVATFSAATVSCVTMAAIGLERRSRWWILLPLSCLSAAVLCLIAVPPVATCR